MGERRIRSHEIAEAVANGEIIEDYREDKYGPSRLILGTTRSGQILHVQCSEPRPEVIVVTCYKPDPDEWIDHRHRRR